MSSDFQKRLDALVAKHAQPGDEQRQHYPGHSSIENSDLAAPERRSSSLDPYLAAINAGLGRITEQHRKKSDYALWPPQEDSRNEDPIPEQPELAAPERPIDWAQRQLEQVRVRPLTDDQVIALSQVYASLAAVEQYDRIAAALEQIPSSLASLSDFATRVSEALETLTQALTPDEHESPAEERTERPGAHSEEQGTGA